MSRQKILITVLSITLGVVLFWFVIIDNVVLPTIQQDMQLSYQNGYRQGMQDSIAGLFQQSNACQPVNIWIGNSTKQIIDVACLSPIDGN